MWPRMFGIAGRGACTGAEPQPPERCAVTGRGSTGSVLCASVVDCLAAITLASASAPSRVGAYARCPRATGLAKRHRSSTTAKKLASASSWFGAPDRSPAWAPGRGLGSPSALPRQGSRWHHRGSVRPTARPPGHRVEVSARLRHCLDKVRVSGTVVRCACPLTSHGSGSTSQLACGIASKGLASAARWFGAPDRSPATAPGRRLGSPTALPRRGSRRRRPIYAVAAFRAAAMAGVAFLHASIGDSSSFSLFNSAHRSFSN